MFTIQRRPRMNACTTMDRASIHRHALGTVYNAHRFTAAAALVALERQRGYQAEAELARLLKQERFTPQGHAPFITLLRQRIGAALLHARDHLAGVPRSGVSLETAAAMQIRLRYGATNAHSSSLMSVE